MVKVALPETTWLEVGDIFVDEDKIKNFENLVNSKKLIGSLIFRMLKKCVLFKIKRSSIWSIRFSRLHLICKMPFEKMREMYFKQKAVYKYWYAFKVLMI